MAVATDWRNPCGGERWRFLPDGTVEVEGRGILLAPPKNMVYLRQTWENWQAEMREAAEATGIPAEWLLAYATVESGLWSSSRESQAKVGSSAGAIGVMQIMPLNAPSLGITVADLYDGATNIRGGATLLARMVDKGMDLVSATAPYNSGCGFGSTKKPCCSPGKNPFALYTASVEGMSYPELTLRYVNSALLELGVAKRASVLPWLLAGALGFLAFAWAKGR